MPREQHTEAITGRDKEIGRTGSSQDAFLPPTFQEWMEGWWNKGFFGVGFFSWFKIVQQKKPISVDLLPWKYVCLPPWAQLMEHSLQLFYSFESPTHMTWLVNHAIDKY